MKNNNEILTNQAIAIEGFDPNKYKQYYPDGTAYLPFKVQLAWFRARYPRGKLLVFRPSWSEEKEAGTYMASARVYTSADAPVDTFLAEASARRGPDTKLVETGEAIDAYNAVQIAAMSLALKLAGFWVSITDADLTKELETANAPAVEPVAETPAETSEEVPQTESPDKTAADGNEGDKKPRRARRKKAETSATEESSAPAEAPTAEEASANENAPVTEESSVTEEAPATEADAVEEPSAIEESASVEVPVAAETSVNENTSVAEEPAVAEENATEESSTTEESVPAEEPVSEETSANESVSVTEESTEAEENAAEEPSTTEESVLAEESVAETVPAAETTPVAEETAEAPSEEQLAEWREIYVNNGYWQGTIGEMEQGKIDGVELPTNLVKWFYKSPMAQKKHTAIAAAVKGLVDAVHKDWAEEYNK